MTNGPGNHYSKKKQVNRMTKIIITGHANRRDNSKMPKSHDLTKLNGRTDRKH